MSVSEILIPAPESYHDLLVALLESDVVHAFEERAGELVLFVGSEDADASFIRSVEQKSTAFRTGPILVREIEDRNWNAEWEATIQPIRVGPFVVRPSWSDPPEPGDDAVDLVIDPQMSFGTAYHESTRLLLRSLTDVVRPGMRVLDAGTGTGILAIAALLAGAESAVGFDIDPWALSNAPQNAMLNHVGDRFDVREGTLDTVASSARFDAAFANINRRVLEEMLPRLAQAAPVVGISGLLVSDRPRMIERVASSGMRIRAEMTEQNWWAAWAGRPAGGSE
jgi:ribosomal protein L11 methyltransferase